jgi:hypothetical protein
MCMYCVHHNIAVTMFLLLREFRLVLFFFFVFFRVSLYDVRYLCTYSMWRVGGLKTKTVVCRLCIYFDSWMSKLCFCFIFFFLSYYITFALTIVKMLLCRLKIYTALYACNVIGRYFLRVYAYCKTIRTDFYPFSVTSVCNDCGDV